FSIFPLLFPALMELWVPLGGLIWLLTLKKKHQFFAIEEPMRVKKTLFGGKKTVGKGIFCVGFEDRTNRRVWLSDDAARTHFLVVGSTGSGKTRFLLALLYLALLV